MHIRAGGALIDIREPHEHAQGVAAGVFVAMSQLAQRLTEVPTICPSPCT